MLKSFAGLLTLTTGLLLSSLAYAEDCGFPPQNKPVIPDGTTATRDIMTAASESVRSYANVMNQHLNCLQANRDGYFFNMTREQQQRWVEDYNSLVDGLEEVENALNTQIRTFNAKQES